MSLVVKGDLLKFTGDVIVQQSNCLTTSTFGLSKSIKKEFGVDPYSIRKESKIKNIAIKEDRDVPGTIQIFETDIRPKYIACLFAQYQPSTPNKYPKYKNVSTKIETFKIREEWFKECLNKLKEWVLKNDIKSIAFPYKIGCGLGGGIWKNYYSMILLLNEELNDVSDVNVSIIQL